MKIIYVCGLGHSGSTILDMSLGCHSKIVGLGEVNNILKADSPQLNDNKFRNIFCSCKKQMDDCFFWSKVRQSLLNNDSGLIIDKYEELISIFENSFGNDKILLDSSKNLNPYLLELKRRHDIKIIFLVRDFRGWSYSMNLKTGKKLITLPFEWAKSVIKTVRFLKKNKFDYALIGYEEFALYPKMILPILCDFLEINYETELLTPYKTKSHIIRGNTLRGDRQKTASIQYDARWMTSVLINCAAILFFPFMFLNKKYVYSNFIKPKVTAFKKTQDDFFLFSNKITENLIGKGWGQKKR